MYSHYMTTHSSQVAQQAVVIGGGIAGPVAAMALQRAGWTPVIHEAHDQGSDGVGAFLTLAVNGLAALDVLGLREAVEGLGMATPAMTLVGRGGKVLGTFAMQARTVSRGDLYTVLRDEAVRRGIEVRYGKRLLRTEYGVAGSAGPAARAWFADGDHADGDLLVGADGLRSRVRQLLDPGAPAARHVGLLNTAGHAHGVATPGEPGVAHLVFGKRCFFGYFVHPDGDVWWFANPPSPLEPTREKLLAITSDQWRARLVDLFRDDTGPMLDLIAATLHIVPGWNTYDFPTVPVWHDDRTVIIGDAAHATSPSSGQGASMAIEDGVVLALCLRDCPDTATALVTYEGLRRRRVERVVAYGRRSGSGKAAGPVAARLRDLMLPLVMARFASAESQAWMHDYRIDWDRRIDCGGRTDPSSPVAGAERR